jgi:hypothetical protein
VAESQLVALWRDARPTSQQAHLLIFGVNQEGPSAVVCRHGLETTTHRVHVPPERVATTNSKSRTSRMSFSMSQASLPTFEIGLNALSAILAKAEAFAAAKKIDPAVLLNTRLAPDMFPLIRQVQVATDLAKNGAARLAGVEPPRYEDKETTIGELRARLANTVAFIKTLDTKKIDAAADRQITFPLGPTNKGQMRGDDYLNHFVLPNVYFHLTAAYAILRHCGVEIGKQDFLGAIPIQVT